MTINTCMSSDQVRMTSTDYTMTMMTTMPPPRAPTAIPEVDKFLGIILLVSIQNVIKIASLCLSCAGQLLKGE